MRRAAAVICISVVLLVGLGLGGTGVSTEASPSLVWVRDEMPVVNANQDPQEIYAPEARFAGSFTKTLPTDSRFTTQECYVDNGTKYYDFTITCDFDTPPLELAPGQSYVLAAAFSHGGTHNQGGEGMGEQFWYSSEPEGLAVPATVLKYYPWSPGFNGPSSQEWTLTAPQASAGATFELYASLWNRPACNVTWTYRAEEQTAVASGAEPGYGVVEIDGVLHLTSPPGEVLELSRSDLPAWARDVVATAGDLVACVGPPAELIGGDPNVLLDGLPVIRVGDSTSHGGRVVQGSLLIVVNGVPAATIGGPVTCPMITGMVPHVGGPIVGRPVHPRTEGWAYWNTRYPHVCAFMVEAAKRGATRIFVTDDGSFQVGDVIMIGGSSNAEEIEAARVTGKGSLILDRPLLHDHARDEWVVVVPDEMASLLEPPTAEATTTGEGPGSTFGSDPPWILAVALSVVAAASIGVGVYLLRRKKRTSGATIQQADTRSANDEQEGEPS